MKEPEFWISYLVASTKSKEGKAFGQCRIGHFSNWVFIATKFSWNDIQARHVSEMSATKNECIFKQNPSSEHEREYFSPKVM